jgi:hypothetical protein
MTVGNIHLSKPDSAGGIRMLLPGINIHNESHTSPRTWEKDVRISAKITSEK